MAAEQDGVDRFAPARTPPGHQILGGILRYDRKLASYKIALLRALNDIALAFPDVSPADQPVAVPLRLIAEFWLAYYWPFMDEDRPVYQAPRAQRDGTLRQDVTFRARIAAVPRAWTATVITVRPSDGFFLMNEMRVARRARTFAPEVVDAYSAAVWEIAKTIGKNPVQYAGQGTWGVFPRPARRRYIRERHLTVPRADPDDICVLVAPDLWRTFTDFSLWIEALCIHQWCLFLETVNQGDGEGADRGLVYRMLTDHPDNRMPLTWDRNAIDVLMLEPGGAFRCPWTRRPLSDPKAYDLEHIVPVAVYPLNEIWNLVPADRRFNQRTKRDRLPTDAALRDARPVLAETYARYLASPSLGQAVRDDAAARFSTVRQSASEFPSSLAAAVEQFVARMRDGRGVATFG
jgi:hypothetical protein